MANVDDHRPANHSDPASPAPWVPLLPYQRRDVENPARFTWNCWSRQTGKSFTKSLRRLLRALSRRRNQVFLSAGERQSRELMNKVRQHCQALRIAFDYHELDVLDGLSAKRLEVVLPGGIRILALPANPNTARGYAGDVFLDEFAMHNDDREIWAATFPMLLRGNGELDVASTPRGRDNVFYRLRDNPQFDRSIVTLPQAVDQGLDVDVELLREAMGDAFLFRQEFLCEFLDDSTTFLTESLVASCEEVGLSPARSLDELADDAGNLYVGVDVGRIHDLTVVWAWGETAPCKTSQFVATPGLDVWSGAARAEEMRALCPNPAPTAPRLTTAAMIELRNAPFRHQAELLVTLLQRPKVRKLAIDAGGLGMQLAEELVDRFGEDRIEPVTFSIRTKSRLALALRSALESRSVIIPADAALRRDWTSLRRTVGASGQLVLTADRGPDGHADRFWAAALALHATSATPPMSSEVTLARPLQFASRNQLAIW